MTKVEAQRAVLAIASAIIEAVKDVAPDGAPAASLYHRTGTGTAATLGQFEQLMGALGRGRQAATGLLPRPTPCRNGTKAS